MGSKKRPPPVPSEGSVKLDGTTVEYSKYISKQTGRLETIVVDPGDFPNCPICFEADPVVAEHVPPEALGGRVMTKTCHPCNNDFGPAEDHLRRFLDLEVTVHAEATDGSIPGRRAATVGLRSVPGQPNIAVIRTRAPEFDDIINTGKSAVTVKPLDMALVVAATLKHAYLAACLHQRKVPITADTNRVRAVLLAARSRDRVAVVNALSKIPYLTLPGWIEGDSPYPVLLAEPVPDHDMPWVFLFGNRFVTPWPFPDVEPRGAQVARAQADPVGDSAE